MRDLEQEKEDFFDRYNISDYDKQTVQLASLIVWAKPRRKDFQSALYASVESLQKYIGKRLHLSLSQIRSMAPEQIRSALVKDVPADIHLVNEISACHVCLPDATGDVDILVGRQSKEFFSQQNAPQKKEYIANADEMFGACAYRGKATGVVKIINRPEDMQKMNIGDVLVSIATTPSIVMAMKKASAIITDEGGLTCHASIVSRELGIPCVVGVKIATSILQDGDIVEVDATHAKVTKI